jgi:hypothetical protein
VIERIGQAQALSLRLVNAHWRTLGADRYVRRRIDFREFHNTTKGISPSLVLALRAPVVRGTK